MRLWKKESLKIFLVSTAMVLNIAAAEAGLANVWSLIKSSDGGVGNYPQIISNLIDRGLYFTSIPYIKEYLVSSSSIKNKEIDQLIDKVVTVVGIKQFEILPIRVLARSKAPILRYILAKKYFREGKYTSALSSLNASIPNNHSSKPFALLLEGSIFSITKRYKNAIEAYKECISKSDSDLSKYNNKNRKRQLKINRDYCVVGIARAQFSAGSFDRANLSYLDLEKSSHIWPEILFEEAWNSFYQRDFNRTLGKLVTYKAPLLTYIFNPEIEVLRALTFFELCLYGDAKKVAASFQEKYEAQSGGLSGLLRKHGKDYKYYYLLAKTIAKGRQRGNRLIIQLTNSIIRDPTYRELHDSFQDGREELAVVRGITNRTLRRVLSVNLRDALLLQRNLIGGYVRKGLELYKYQLRQSFIGMSNIKLEILRKRKKELYYLEKEKPRARGDIKNLKRNEKQ
ncbi:MAG: hypothetical protein HN509_12535, partial [Halobacteriovoraceae bacterium]|nr:hypothetical protein [Halobacteriovoraceae bacterium]